MTIGEAKKLHQELWLWLAENPQKGKRDWPRWEFNKGKIPSQENACFACSISLEERCGKMCPIRWPGMDCVDDNLLWDDNGLFSQWSRCKKVTERTKLARQIANLPWRENELP